MASKERKALGTGLGVLFGEEDLNEGGDITVVPIGRIEPRQDQPRDIFDEEKLGELADSIARYGVISPITVRKLESGFYQIIAGERRWRASRLAGLDEVPVRIIDADDKRTAEIALVENLQREDLNALEEARGYKTLMEDFGLTQEEAAQSVGKSRPAVANALRLLNLCPEVIKLVESNELSAGHARAILPITDAALQLRAANEIISKGLSVRKAEQLTKAVLQPPKPKREPSSGIDYGREVSDALSKALGRRVNLLEGKTGGKIILEYYNADDREALIEQLKRIK